jgi:hypothetical protein
MKNTGHEVHHDVIFSMIKERERERDRKSNRKKSSHDIELGITTEPVYIYDSILFHM